MRVILSSALLTTALATCPGEPRTDPRPDPLPAGAGGAAGAGAAGTPSAGTGGSSTGGQGCYQPGGSAGAPTGGHPLCSLPPASDPAVETIRHDVGIGLAKLGGGSPDTWLFARDFTGAAVVAIAPVASEPPWDAARLGLVLARMPGGGHIEEARLGCATCGVRSPCPGVAERQTAIVRGVAVPASKGSLPTSGTKP
jgi:hypothetical protein